MDDDVIAVLMGLGCIIVTGVIISIVRYRSRIRIDFEEMRYASNEPVARDYLYAVLRHQFDERIHHVEITADNYVTLVSSIEGVDSDFSALNYQDILDYWNALTGKSQKRLISSSKCATLIFTTQHGPRRIDSVIGKQDALLGLWLKC